MGRKIKYSKELKFNIVRRYLNDEGSSITLAKEINTSDVIIIRWVKKYQVFGESAFLDLYDRTIVGYEVGDHNNNILVFNTFQNVVRDNLGAHPLFHSDGGYQYTSPKFINMLKK